MDKEWVFLKEKEHEEYIQHLKKDLKESISKQILLPKDSRDKFISLVDQIEKSHNHLDLQYMYFDSDIFEIDDSEMTEKQKEDATTLTDWNKRLENSINQIYMYYRDWEFPDSEMHPNNRFKKYLDSDPVHFEGDIIITDPCYIMKKTGRAKRDEWGYCECGDRLDLLGIKTFMTRSTLYGDWSCTTIDVKTGEPIGNFCADAGLVSVLLLDEVLKYNPDFNYHKERTWTTTWIKNFNGDVQFIVKRSEGKYEDTTKYHRAGDSWEEFEVQVHGNGVNTETGDPIRFFTTQTGL